MIPTSVTTVLAVGGQLAADAGDDASQRLSYVIVGLVGLAVVIAIATVVFWRLTRPESVSLDAGLRWVADPPVDPAATPRPSPPAAADGEVAGTPPTGG